MRSYTKEKKDYKEITCDLLILFLGNQSAEWESDES